MTISPDIQNSISPANAQHKICGFNQESDASYTCIEEQHLNSSLNLLKKIGKELQERALARNCRKITSISNLLCVKDILAKNQHSEEILHILKDIFNCQYLVDQNKQWGLQNTDQEGNLITLEEVLDLRQHQKNCFAISQPTLPLKCHIFNKVQTIFVLFGCICLALLVFYVGNLFYKFVMHVKEKRKELVKRLITEIINALVDKSNSDQENPAIVISHMRDKLIEPTKRREYEAAWNEAIRFLELNDSRIQFEMRNINGEDFKMMRWMSGSLMYNGGPSNSNSNRHISKKWNWNCPAFDKCNKIKDPPTQCLKIRQMFDKEDTEDPNLHEIIQNSILNKLRDKNCRIHDIQLDLKTYCVYVKCASNVDAGIVHESVNGWWFGNRLVSIKFLRLERYLQRFPNSANSTACLRPSSTSTLSGHNHNNNNDYYEEGDYEEDEDN